MSAARRQRAVSLALGVLAALWAPASAQAREGPSGDPSAPWDLQPKGPRLFLDLPAHWLPPTNSAGALDLGDGVVLVRHSGRDVELAASFSGTTLQLNLEHRSRSRSLDFELFVKTQSVVAVLRFDPIPSRLR